VGSSIPRANIPSAAEFFRSSLDSPAPPMLSVLEAAASLLDNLDEGDPFLAAFRGGLLPPDTVPRVFKCYATDGPVVKSDTTCWLWLWIGEDTAAQQQQQQQDDAGDDGDAEVLNAAVYSTATNVSYLPLVQSNPATDTVGLTVAHGGRCLVRASSAGVSSSVDAGRAWTEPQLSCLVGAVSLDGAASLCISSRAAVALQTSAVDESKQNRRIHVRPGAGGKPTAPTAAVSAAAESKWALFPLPSDLGVSIITDVAVLS
jgi:hypothetical protein